MFGIFEPEWRKLGYSSKREYENAMARAIEDRSKQDIQRIRAQGALEIEKAQQQLEDVKAQNRNDLEADKAYYKSVMKKINNYYDQKAEKSRKETQKIIQKSEENQKNTLLQIEMDRLAWAVKFAELELSAFDPEDPKVRERREKIQVKIDVAIKKRDSFMQKHNLKPELD